MRKAIITLIYDAEELFKIWYRYYTKFFSEEDIYVLSFQASPHIFEGLKCNVTEIPHSIFSAGQGPAAPIDALMGVAKANKLQRKLFREGYQCVVYADLDEIIFYPEGIDTLIKNGPSQDRAVKFITTTGYEIVQNRKKEAPLDFTKPILDQRSYWFRYDAYDKPLILWDQVDWIPGFHAVEGYRNHKWISKKLIYLNRVPDFYLLHLHKLDETLTKRMHTKHNLHAANGVLHEESFENWWKSAEDHLTLIPDILKKSGL